MRMSEWFIVGLALFVVGALIGFGMWGIPTYSVWRKGLAGQAQLKQAEWNRQIAVREASAKKDSASLLAEAEVERAKGVAEANRIIGKSLKGNSAYLRYLWIQGLHDGSSEIIYVPTEANLPILEAARHSVRAEKSLTPAASE